jgi:hypothetical protein
MALTTLAACGSSSDSAGGGGGGSSDRARKAPQAILRETAAALAKVKSYHLAGSGTDAKDGRLTMAADVAGDGRLSLTLDNEGKKAAIRVIGRTTYMRANRGFWESQGSGADAKVVRLLAGRWVKVPGGAADFLRGLLPKDIGYCMLKESGGLRKAGTRTVDGKPMIVIADKGDKPGSSPGELYVPADGPALPTRVVQTGRQKPGGTPDPRCDDDNGSTTTASDFRIGGYDEPVDITAPKGALDLKDLQRGTTTGDEQAS